MKETREEVQLFYEIEAIKNHWLFNNYQEEFTVLYSVLKIKDKRAKTTSFGAGTIICDNYDYYLFYFCVIVAFNCP